MSSTSLVIALVLVGFLAQYALGWKQAQRFSQQVSTLRRTAGPDATLSIGVGRRRGRRAYVAVVTDAERRKITDALVMHGGTVFASAKPLPEVIGASVKKLARSEVPLGSPLLSIAAAQAAEFLLHPSRTAAVQSAA